jgi:hypothetical protein
MRLRKAEGGARDPQQQGVDAAIALQQAVQPRLWCVPFAARVESCVERVHLRRHEVALRPGAVRIALVAVAHGLVHLSAPHLELLKPLLPRAAVALRVRARELLQAGEGVVCLAGFGGQRQETVATVAAVHGGKGRVGKGGGGRGRRKGSARGG